MIDVSSYPLCAARMKFFRANFSEASLTYYWAAVAIVADISDKALAKFGGFDFSDRSEENGKRLMARLEQFCSKGRKPKVEEKEQGMSPAEASVRSFLGANGVKVSMLSGLTDYWIAAHALWPDHVQKAPKVIHVSALCAQVSAIPRKQRPKLARANISRIHPDWRA